MKALAPAIVRPFACFNGVAPVVGNQRDQIVGLILAKRVANENYDTAEEGSSKVDFVCERKLIFCCSTTLTATTSR